MNFAKTFCLAAGLAVLATLAGPAGAQSFPNRPIRFIVPSGPGIVTDNVARYLADKLRDQKGWTVVVENRPGGNYVVGMQALLTAPADGYSIFMGVSSMALIPVTNDNLQINLKKDFTLVTKLVSLQNALFATPTTPYSTLPELITYTKANPDKVSFGSIGAGSITSLAGEQMNMSANIKLANVPYKDMTLITDVMAGNIGLGIIPPFNIAPQVTAGKLKAIAVMGSQRSPLLPGVPSTAELGHADVNADGWLGIMVKSGVAPDIVQTLQAEISKIVNQPDSKEKLMGMGLLPVGGSSEQFAREYADDLLRWEVFAKKKLEAKK